MKLQDDDIREFSEIWLEEFHETLSMEEVRFCASLLLELYSVLVRPLPTESPAARKPAAKHRT
jgi:hypothetical protein